MILLVLIIGVFLNIERLDVGGELDIVNLQSFVYFLAFFAVFLTLLIPEKYRPSIIIILGFWWVIYFVAKLTVFYRHPILGGYFTSKAKNAPTCGRG